MYLGLTPSWIEERGNWCHVPETLPGPNAIGRTSQVFGMGETVHGRSSLLPGPIESSTHRRIGVLEKAHTVRGDQESTDVCPRTFAVGERSILQLELVCS